MRLDSRGLVGITLAFLLFILAIFLSSLAVAEQFGIVQSSSVLGLSAANLGTLAFITFVASGAAKIRHELMV